MLINAENVEPTSWLSRHERARAEGLTFDFLTASDGGECVHVLSRLMSGSSDQWLTTRICEEPLESLISIFPGADWYERECAEMFDITFSGRIDCRPLLGAKRGVMRKSVLLQPRLDTPWPGAAEAGDDGRRGANPSRRRLRPAGVPETADYG
jgi:hypothetical protein